MILNTRHFGEITVDEEKLITFAEGIPGFPALRQFLLLSEQASGEDDADEMFYWLQSVEETETAFVLLDMMKYKPDYNPFVEESQVECLGTTDPADFLIYNIAVMPGDPKRITVNLRAPIVINPEKRLGKQVICTNDDYDIQHKLFA